MLLASKYDEYRLGWSSCSSLCLANEGLLSACYHSTKAKKLAINNDSKSCGRAIPDRHDDDSCRQMLMSQSILPSRDSGQVCSSTD